MNKMNVTLRQLRAFVEVAEAKHFTRAADKLELSQSTVSSLVRELEANLDLRLFDRHTRMLSLTQAGAEILPLARKALADLDSVLGSSSDLKTLGRGRVSIAASSLQAALMLPRMIREFGVAHPGVTVDLHDVAQPDVPEMVRSGAVDFGIGTESGLRQDVASRLLTTDTYAVMMPAGHALSRKKELTWRDLEGYPLIGSPAGNPLREQIDMTLARHGITLTRSYEVALPLTIIGMVEGGLGIAVLTTTATRLALALGLVVKPVVNPVITRKIALLFHADRSLSPAAQNFSDLLFKRRAQLLTV
ncbi:LysR family transcriptional regulator [Variovorax sp. PBL-E5]|uniref:LysR family transcriptional regulator n=1 Tax=Variovorax sp. PBL-E5 TaxID=434014 RepID=UPI0013185255|nr:HTH-type transcriptional regulator GltC [Variovorax sp. PBL-E5]